MRRKPSNSDLVNGGDDTIDLSVDLPFAILRFNPFTF